MPDVIAPPIIGAAMRFITSAPDSVTGDHMIGIRPNKIAQTANEPRQGGQHEFLWDRSVLCGGHKTPAFVASKTGLARILCRRDGTWQPGFTNNVDSYDKDQAYVEALKLDSSIDDEVRFYTTYSDNRELE